MVNNIYSEIQLPLYVHSVLVEAGNFQPLPSFTFPELKNPDLVSVINQGVKVWARWGNLTTSSILQELLQDASSIPSPVFNHPFKSHECICMCLSLEVREDPSRQAVFEMSGHQESSHLNAKADYHVSDNEPCVEKVQLYPKLHIVNSSSESTLLHTFPVHYIVCLRIVEAQASSSSSNNCEIVYLPR